MSILNFALHRLGHTLDIVMFRPTDDIVCSSTATYLVSSDHCCVACDISAIKPVNHAELTQSRNSRGIKLTTFKADICQLISTTLCPSIRCLMTAQGSYLRCTHRGTLAEYQ